MKLGILKHSLRKLINETVWPALEEAIKEAKHSLAGAPGEMTDREFLEPVLHLLRTGSPWRDLPPELRYWHAVYMRFRRREARGVWVRLWQNLQAEPFCASPRTVPGFDHGTGPSTRRRGAQKNGPDQALGCSRSGLSTKIHAATIDENCAMALHLTPGQAHDGRQFESLYKSLDPDNVLEFAALDKGDDDDRIRERLASDGIEPVIPPISTRSQKLPDDKELYRGRNRIERLFNRLKQFRRLATRYDKLAKTFFAAVHLVSAFLIIRNS